MYQCFFISKLIFVGTLPLLKRLVNLLNEAFETLHIKRDELRVKHILHCSLFFATGSFLYNVGDAEHRNCV